MYFVWESVSRELHKAEALRSVRAGASGSCGERRERRRAARMDFTMGLGGFTESWSHTIFEGCADTLS